MTFKMSRAALSALVAFLFSTVTTAQDTTYLKIIVSTDVHGSVLPYDILDARSRPNSLAQVYSYVMNERQKKNQEVIFLDNGDILQGDPFIYYYNFIDTSGIHPMARVMNFMQYDATTIGNHDIEAGHPVYDKLNMQFDFPWLGANIIDETTGLPYFKPYTMIEKNNKKIAILGLCTPAIPQWLPEELWSGMHFEDMLVSARSWVRYIQRNEKPDLLIGLFHSGAPDVEYPDGIPANLEQASRVIAQRVAGFDVVFTGHDHRRWNEFVPNLSEGYTLLLGGGNNARNLAVADIILISDTISNSTRKELQGNIADMTKLPAHEGFLDQFFDYVYPVQDFVKQPVGALTDSLFSRDALFGSSMFVNLVHHIQLEITKADLSFSAPLSFDAVIPAGKLTRGDLFKLYRYENQLYTMQLSGQEVLDVLEFSYSNWLNQMKTSSDHLLNFVKDEQGKLVTDPYGRPQTATPHFNFESAAGIIYTVDVSKPAGQRVNIISMIDGRPFSADSTYEVAINSYRASGGGGHLTTGAGIPHDELNRRITYTSGQDLRFMIMEWIRENKVPPSSPYVNWSIVPTDWHLKGKAKDAALLFKK
ncbi:MAG: bifunctional metallophosphatase/5'-nucleotidase [Bacteroidales bacterium]|nr:bifunctional metallophosphatase/5'-nucleotidase [Bacteroidales bacterium]